MPGGHEIRNRSFRWREITVTDHGASNMAVVEEIAKWLADKRLEFSKVDHLGPQGVSLAYGPAFSDETRKIIYSAITEKWPNAKIGFYGEEAVTILRAAVCLDRFIQGGDS